MMTEKTNMHWIGWVVVVLAFIEGGWLAFDGGRALVVGDYVTPESGQYAGQLGPWAKVVSAVGIEPRSTLMKSIHLVLRDWTHEAIRSRLKNGSYLTWYVVRT